MKADVRMDDRGKTLTYEVPDGTKPGDRVSAPLPYFLATSSTIGDWPQGYTGIVIGPGTYHGPCVKARVLNA